MSTTRPYSPGDRGPEPSGASGASEGGVPGTGDAGRGASAAETSGEGAVPSLRPEQQAAAAAAASAARQVRRLDFEGQSGVVPLARDFARQALYAWGWLPAATADQRAAAEDVLLVVSELVTNACLHAEGPDEMWIACDNKVIRIEVSDKGNGQPAPRTPHRAGRPGGHGMFIVQRLCLDWGVVRQPGVAGKTVWAELGAPA
ncbi:ATP-binding protein [Streptomyces sp. NPDC056464]|uniref:ATP-binding protein n=1 Tax=Streptomyces sp. NPDC056464 TaxID=3345828 RepID=UPI00367B0FE1